MTALNQPEIATSQREVTEREAGQQASEAAARLQSEAAREMAAQGSGANSSRPGNDSSSRASQSEAMTTGPEAILPSLEIDMGPSGKPLPLEGPQPPQQPPSESSNGGAKSDWTPPKQDNR